MRNLFVHAAIASTLAISAASLTSTADLLADDLSRAVPRDDKAIAHALNRIGFGPRPGDVARVKGMGLARYLDLQLHPEQIADAATDGRLAGLTTIRMSSEEIQAKFERPEMEARRERQLRAAAAGTDEPPQPPPQREPGMQPRNQVMLELSQQKLIRAIYSERQLQEVLTDFWFNHFNVDARKGRDRFLLTEYERDAIRPRVLGSFRELLEATAKSPAMLFYLDNWLSVDPAAARPDRGMRQAGNRKQGLNENYGRELMELHTLGVDGGYTQKDVTEVARAFTGWTIENPRQGASYIFDARHHDRGEKVVLGRRIKAGGGESDGEEVLDILAAHPSTARFIATKLVRRFVNDTPPAALVDRVAGRFRETGGDIREMMRVILTSPEFFAPDAYRAKVKTPFEFVASAMRATGADVQDATPLVRTLQELGMPLYSCQPPTGYKDTADAWVNTGALVGRMNFALSLTSGRVRGIEADARASIDAMLNGDVSESTRATIAQATTAPQAAALTLGSPEFQRR